MANLDAANNNQQIRAEDYKNKYYTNLSGWLCLATLIFTVIGIVACCNDGMDSYQILIYTICAIAALFLVFWLIFDKFYDMQTKKFSIRRVRWNHRPTSLLAVSYAIVTGLTIYTVILLII